MSKLVIVESPAKAKTIKKYLGKNYEVVASMGHIRDLLKSKLSVDIENNFEPHYMVIRGKTKFVNELKKLAQKSDYVYLATDPDREGEAISWHLSYLLGLDPDEENRVTFNEITKSGVTYGMNHPRKIDMDLVNAQQARRILDRLVGYKLSPFVSQKIRRGLSAGRVQSVAVRIIVDREEEIRKFVPEEYWTIEAKLLKHKEKLPFTAMFYGNSKGKIKIETLEQVNSILTDLKDAEYKVVKYEEGTRKKRPAPPFITSTMQQEASRKLGFTAKRTMKIAQELYEGIDVKGYGAIGLITYMRTDSIRISDDALKDVRSYIKERWGEKYLPKEPKRFKSKSNAQDGHEAIRPTMPGLHPDKVKESLTSEQYKLYKLIWSRFTACQMSDCVLATRKADIEANSYIFKASGYIVSFDGFTVLYEESRDEETAEASTLPKLGKGMILKLKELTNNQHFTQPPSRFTEASLIKALEEDGIGRPSTYATTISTILSREYIVKEGKTLKPTELGEVITNLMKERFPNIVNVKFTAGMETDLDTVESGKTQWVKILENFYGDFSETLEKAQKDMEGVKIQLKEDETDIVCEKCGRKMVIKVGKYGKFIACPGYPECKNIKKIVNETGAECPKCGGKIITRKSKKGRLFYGCDNYPKCDFLSWDEPSKEKCPNCGKHLFIKKGKQKKLYCITENCGYEKVENK